MAKMDETEDYVDAVRPCLKQMLSTVAQAKAQVMDRSQATLADGEWNLRFNLCVLFEWETSGETRRLAMCVDLQNGHEAWRLPVGRFQPQAGVRRMKEIAELMALQNKRCMSASETSLVVLELDRIS